MALKLMLMLLGALNFSTSHPLFFEKGSHGEGILELPAQCNGIQGENATHTDNLKLECTLIFSNEYVKWSERLLADKDFVKNLPIHDASGRNRRSLKIPGCPTFTPEYLRTNRLPRQRSISPWVFIENFDRNRVPRTIVDTRCLCKGCIDPETAEEDTINMFSMAIPVTIKTIKNSVVTKMSVGFGCACIIKQEPTTTTV